MPHNVYAILSKEMQLAELQLNCFMPTDNITWLIETPNLSHIKKGKRNDTWTKDSLLLSSWGRDDLQYNPKNNFQE